MEIVKRGKLKKVKPAGNAFASITFVVHKGQAWGKFFHAFSDSSMGINGRQRMRTKPQRRSTQWANEWLSTLIYSPCIGAWLRAWT